MWVWGCFGWLEVVCWCAVEAVLSRGRGQHAGVFHRPGEGTGLPLRWLGGRSHGAIVLDRDAPTMALARAKKGSGNLRNSQDKVTVINDKHFWLDAKTHEAGFKIVSNFERLG